MGLRAPPPRRQMPPSDPGYDGDYPAGIDFPAGIDNPSDERKEFEKTLAPVGADLIGRAVTNDSRDKLGLQDQENTGGPSGKLVMVNPDQPAFEDSYIPPRPQWQPETTPSGYQTPPAELPAPTDPSNIELTKSKTNRISGSYYEDVAPQFDNSHETDPPTTPQPILPIPGPGAQIGQFNPAPAPATGGPWNPPPIPQLEEGQLSPTISTTSGFTSISQRGINPSWQEEQKRVGGPRPVGRTNVGLAGNPDFELPPGRGGRGVRGGRGGRGGLR